MQVEYHVAEIGQGQGMKTDHVKREVIENQLLAALDDKRKAAVLCSKKDLALLLRALGSHASAMDETRGPLAVKELEAVNEFRAGLLELHAKTFGPIG